MTPLYVETSRKPLRIVLVTPALVPKWLAVCDYTIDNEASPKTVSVSWTARRGMIIFFR